MAHRTNTAEWIESKKHWRIHVQKNRMRRSFYSSIPGRTGQRACHKKADAWLDDGIDAKAKVSSVADDYIKAIKKRGTSRDHWRQHEGFCKNWIKPRLGRRRFDDTTENDWQDIIDSAFDEKKLAHKTLCNLRGCIVALVKYARIGKKTSLVFEALKIPKGAKRSKKKILQPRDLQILFSSEETILRGKPCFDHFIHAFRTAVLTGVRPGELSAVEPKNVINEALMSITGSINRYGERTSGKNENAIRNAALCDLAYAVIRDQRKMLMRLGVSSRFLFCNEHGERLNQCTFYKRWVRYRDHNGISPVSLYELRHTFVSVIKSLPEGTVKQLVGHSKNMDTFGTYSHEIEDEYRQTGQSVQALFMSILKQSEAK